MVPLPEGLLSGGGGLLLDREGEASGDRFLVSAVRTDERAATAAALCDDPWPLPDGLGAVVLFPEEGLNAEVKAAIAEARWVGPPWFDPLDLSWVCNNIVENHKATLWVKNLIW